MALNANNSKNTGGGGSIDPIEPGTYPARLVMVVDLGLQAQRPYQGQEKQPAYEILTTYELLDEFVKDEDGNDLEDKPRWMSETFPLHRLDADRAKSTIRYKSLDPVVQYGGDWSQLINIACSVTVVQNVGNGKNAGKVFNNIAGVSLMRPRDVKNAPPLVNEPVVFDLDNPDIEEFYKLPNWIQEKIKGGLEFAGSTLDALIKANPKKEETKEPEKKAKKSRTPVEEDLDDEVPF
jgi:hypothetical protein